jgi:hypothetical protein
MVISAFSWFYSLKKQIYLHMKHQLSARNMKSSYIYVTVLMKIGMYMKYTFLIFDVSIKVTLDILRIKLV